MLRPFAPGDMPSAHMLAGDKRVAEMTLLPHPFEDAAAAEWLRRRVEGAERGTSETFSILLREDGDALIGHARLVIDRTNEKAELHYWLGVPYWDRGYAAPSRTSASDESTPTTSPTTRPPGGCSEKIGMKEEGYLRRKLKR